MPPARPYRGIAASLQHTCVLDAQGAITCWGITDAREASPARRLEEGAKRYRLVPRSKDPREIVVSETAIYLRSADGEIEVTDPPWPHRAYAKLGRARPSLPPTPKELSAKFAWLRVRSEPTYRQASTGCARRLAPEPALVCWAAPSVDPVGAWATSVHPELADVVDALPDEKGEPSVIVRSTGKLAYFDARCTKGECWIEDEGLKDVVQSEGPCVLHRDGGVSCQVTGGHRRVAGFEKVSVLLSPAHQLGLSDVHTWQVYGLEADGVVRWVGTTTAQRSGCARRELPYLGRISDCKAPQFDATLPRARAIAAGPTHICVIGLDEEVYCSGSEEALGGSAKPPTSPDSAVRVTP